MHHSSDLSAVPTRTGPGTPLFAQVQSRVVMAVLYQWRWGVVVAALLFAVLAWVYMHTTPKHYAASTQIVLEIKNRPGGGALAGLNSLLPELSTDTYALNTEVEALQSSVLLRALMDKYALLSDAEFNPPAWQTGFVQWLDARAPVLAAAAGWFGIAAPDFDKHTIATYALERLAKAITISTIPNSLVIVITVHSTNANKAALLANGLAALYRDSKANATNAERQETLDWLKAEVTALQKSSQDTEQAWFDFLVQHNVLSVAALQALRNNNSTMTYDFDAALQQNHTVQNHKDLYTTANQLRLDAEINRALYAALLAEWKERVLYHNQPLRHARVISPAYPPVEATQIDMVIVLLLAMLVGGGGMIAVLSVYAHSQVFVRTPQVAARVLSCAIGGVGRLTKPQQGQGHSTCVIDTIDTGVIADMGNAVVVIQGVQHSSKEQTAIAVCAEALQAALLAQGHTAAIVDYAQAAVFQAETDQDIAQGALIITATGYAGALDYTMIAKRYPDKAVCVCVLVIDNTCTPEKLYQRTYDTNVQAVFFLHQR